MNMAHLLVGLSLIGAGLLVKAQPNLIAGYNAMPEDRKRKVDISGLSSFLCKGLMAMGITIIAGYYLFTWIGLTTIADLMILAVTLPGVAVLIIGGQKYNGNSEANSGGKRSVKTKLTYVFLAVVVASVSGMMTYGLIPAKAVFDNDKIRFTGAYGFELDTGDIESVALIEKIPIIMLRTNGFSLGEVNKGEFNLDEYGPSRLMLHSATPPFLVIGRRNNERILINYKDNLKTEELYQQIKSLLDR